MRFRAVQILCIVAAATSAAAAFAQSPFTVSYTHLDVYKRQVE